ncbi:MAG: hypothetical protein ACK5HR_03180 [Mycoplasmatales bacterium]
MCLSNFWKHYCQIKNVDGGLGNGYKSVGSNKNVGVNVGQYPGVQVTYQDQD